MITNAEWQVMAVIWANQGIEANTIYQLVGIEMAWSLSTVKTLLARLVKKGYLSVTKQGKSFHYTTNVSKKEIVADKIKSDITLICQKEQGDIVQYILPDIAMNKQQIDALINLLTTLKEHAPTTLTCNCLKGQCICKH